MTIPIVGTSLQYQAPMTGCIRAARAARLNPMIGLALMMHVAKVPDLIWISFLSITSVSSLGWEMLQYTSRLAEKM